MSAIAEFANLAVGAFRTAASILSILILAEGSLCAQENRVEPSSSARLFIGLTKGALDNSSEADLRSYIELQDLTRGIENLVRGTISDVVIGDLPSWTGGNDELEKLIRKGFTHYVIASIEPVKLSPTEVAVTWLIGTLSQDERLRISARLNQRTQISLPRDSEAPKVRSAGSGGSAFDKEVTAERIANIVRWLSPETTSIHYFVDCFLNQISAAPWTEFHKDLMWRLSRDLEIGTWESSMKIPAPDYVAKMCGDIAYQEGDRYKRADYLIGALFPKPVEHKGKPVVKAHIYFDDQMWRRIQQVATVLHRGTRTPQRPIRDFCFELAGSQTVDSITNLLVEYLQIHGPKIGDMSHVLPFMCDGS